MITTTTTTTKFTTAAKTVAMSSLRTRTTTTTASASWMSNIMAAQRQVAILRRSSSVVAARRRVAASSFTLQDLRRRRPRPVGRNDVGRPKTNNDYCNNNSTTSTLPDHVAKLVKEYTKKQPTSVPLQMLLKTGRGEFLGKSYKDELLSGQHSATKRILLQVARFLRSELPIRLAYRIQYLDSVPLLCEMPSTQVVKDIYVQSFLDLVNFPARIQTSDDEEQFARLLQQLFRKHSDILTQMARGAYELREAIGNGSIQTRFPHLSHRDEFIQCSECHSFLDRFFLSRIGTRVLVGHYLSLRSEEAVEDDYIGLVCLNMSTYGVTKQAIEDATIMCERKYDDSPQVIISGRLDLTFPYVPTYLHYILLELLKNAMVATMEHYYKQQEEEETTKTTAVSTIPPIHVIIADSTENEDVVIKIMDEGGGIPRSQLETKIWSYLFTTASKGVQESAFHTGAKLYADHHNSSPIAGLGFGLPISRAYARYFGGDLDVMSMEGYGTDAYVHLKRLGDSKEPLLV